MTSLPAHSPLGASSAERWMNCPGSVALTQALGGQGLIHEDDPDYRREGTAAHAALAHCLTEGMDAWEVVGHTFEGEVVTVGIADAIQVFIDFARPIMAQASRVYVEAKMHRPDIHPSFFGTVDFAALTEDGTVLNVADYKHGEGVLVPVLGNPQFMYYALGIVRDHPLVKRVKITVVQPRISWQETIRSYETTPEELESWARIALIPAMARPEKDHKLSPGEWCRFCPAKIVCPKMQENFQAASIADPAAVTKLSDEALDFEYALIDTVKMYVRAVEAEMFARLQAGRGFAHTKLVRKKADRVWREGAEEQLIRTLQRGDIYTAPQFKSPAQVEKLGEAAKKLVREFAYTPEAGLTVASKGDGRPEVVVKPVSQQFASEIAAIIAANLETAP